MKTSRYTEAQIIAILRQAEGGVPVAEHFCDYGWSNVQFYKWWTKRAIVAPLAEWMAPCFGIAACHTGYREHHQ